MIDKQRIIETSTYRFYQQLQRINQTRRGNERTLRTFDRI